MNKDRALPMRRPLIALAIGFAAGIVFSDLVHPNVTAAWIAAFAAASIAALLALLRVGGELRFFLWLFAFCALGCARGAPTTRPTPSPPPFGRVALYGVAQTAWKTRPDSAQLDLELQSVRKLGEAEQPAHGRVRLTVWKEALYQTSAPTEPQWPCARVLPGDRLGLFATVHLIKSLHNPGMPDTTRFTAQDVDFVGAIDSCADILPVASDPPASPRRAVEAWRLSIADFLQQREGDPGAKAILLSQTNGDQNQIPKPLRERFQTSGLAHILSISGLHLGIVAGGLYWLLVRLLLLSSFFTLRCDVRRVAAALAIPATVCYTLLAGAQVPAVRSCLMVLCFLLAVIVRRASDPLQTLAAAGLLILGIFPQSLFSVSFQLSFAAVLSMLLFVPALGLLLRLPDERSLRARPWMRRLPTRLTQYVLVSFAATFGTAPLVAWHFNQISLIGPLANLVAVPLSTLLIVPAGLLCVVLLPITQTLAGWVADSGVILSGWLAQVAEWFGGLPFASLHVPTPSLVTVGLWYMVLFLTLLIGRRRRAGLAALAGAAVLTGLVGWGFFAPRFSHELRVTFIDVGQGDSALLRCPGGENWLIDGGPANERFDAGRAVVAPLLWNQGIVRLHGVIASHCHPDHIGGLASIVALFRPEEIWLPEDWRDNPATSALAAAALEVGVVMKTTTASDSPQPTGACGLRVLWPPAQTAILDENDRSLVVRATYGTRSFLFVGDLQTDGEQELLKRREPLNADVLKAGHHGSGSASGAAFLEAVNPSWVVISVGRDNRYQLPQSRTLERLTSTTATVLRTDQHGAVACRTDGEDLTCITVLSPQ